ncbi:MAG: hypothetical protein VB108_08990 [Anaerolineaceae bacterium]|nr:hypothetical protein [Anaerolineaceae bacterium]
MNYSIDYLKQHGGLPGPRANLELIYSFAKSASQPEADECLTYLTAEVHDCPEEFVACCGVLAQALLYGSDLSKAFNFLRPTASHASWRLRETVAMGIQELSVMNLENTFPFLKEWSDGNPYEQRAVAAGLCEPKLLKDIKDAKTTCETLMYLSETLNKEGRLSEPEQCLKKALGYGWSVVLAAYFDEARPYFERLLDLPARPMRWIVAENLKKNRLIRKDKAWVEKTQTRLREVSNS